MLKENEDSSSYVVPLSAFKPKSDTLNGLDWNVMHQMAKDIERDVILINNTRLAHGSKHGYEGICDMLRDEIERAQRFLYFSTTSGKMTLPPLRKSMMNQWTTSSAMYCLPVIEHRVEAILLTF